MVHYSHFGVCVSAIVRAIPLRIKQRDFRADPVHNMRGTLHMRVHAAAEHDGHCSKTTPLHLHIPIHPRTLICSARETVAHQSE